MKPRISVIISAYNCELYVAESIQSIIDQTCGNWEILIADDGSTDRTKSIIDGFNDPRIRRFHNDKNLGLLNTWNNLAGQAKGEYLTWQDADDISFPMRFQKQLSALDADPDLMLCGCNHIRYYPYWGKTIVSNYPQSHLEIADVIKKQQIVPFTGATKMLRRKILDKAPLFRPFFDGLGWEDYDFILRTLENFKVGNIPDVLYEYRYTRGSSSRKINEEAFLKIYMNQVGFFLSDQRHRNNGLDGLMAGGDKQGLDNFLKELKCEFEKDTSILYRKSSLNKISNMDYYYALLDAIKAVTKEPLIVLNYLLFIRLFASLINAGLKRIRTQFHIGGKIVKQL